MSETIPPDDAQTARAYYDRMLAETRKFSAEQNKLAAEARKYDRERWLISIAAIGAVAGAVASIVTLVKTTH